MGRTLVGASPDRSPGEGRYITRDAETGYAPPGIPAWRSYASPAKAKAAAERAAKSSGRPIAYGWAKSGSNTIKVELGIARPSGLEGAR